LAADEGETRLTLRAHPDDPDQRSVGLVWNGCLATRMEPPNDEAISGHRLYDLGMKECVVEVVGRSLRVERGSSA
jgi:hypothetical protein